jgi:hypothetical protein
MAVPEGSGPATAKPQTSRCNWCANREKLRKWTIDGDGDESPKPLDGNDLQTTAEERPSLAKGVG